MDSASFDRPTGRSFADLHCHSAASFDSLSSVERLIANARRFGLSHLAITDHERIDGALRARDVAAAGHPAEPPLRIIVGEEVRTTTGDLIGLFLERPVAPGQSVADTAAAIRDQGGLVGLPHPFDRFRKSGAKMAEGQELDELVRSADYVEAYNARAIGGANHQAAELAAREGLPIVASSDAHSPFEVGVAYTVLPGDFRNARELKELLGQSSLVMGRASYVLRLLTPVAKAINATRGNRRITAATFGSAA